MPFVRMDLLKGFKEMVFLGDYRGFAKYMNQRRFLQYKLSEISSLKLKDFFCSPNSHKRNLAGIIRKFTARYRDKPFGAQP